jgi:1,4-alpha-glucan branching enzyme
MLKRRKISGSNTVKVSFVLPADDARLPASVVGDFNDWNPEADPMVRRSNGTHSAVVALVSGATYRFRYRSHDGTWFNDEGADGYESNIHGSTDGLVEL